MEVFKIENLNFTYPENKEKALDNISITINQGEFVLLCGKSGCGKTTLLRLLKPALSPHGECTGNICFCDKKISDLSLREQTCKIGFVMQNPDNQIVTDKVWHELSFGLESLGYDTNEIRVKVSEMASFFGIEDWFYKNVKELSGGQKQILNLASVMVMQPDVLILDEPTSQLDPIAADDFLKILEKINQELATTVILSEHRLETAMPLSERVIVMDNGKIISDADPYDTGEILKEKKHDMYFAMPVPVRIWGAVENDLKCPVTVREGRLWLETIAKDRELKNIKKEKKMSQDNTIIELKDVWFRYEKESPDVIKGLDLKINKGELFSILGGNGSGKTTTLSLICGINKQYRGKVLIEGKKLSEIPDLYENVLGVLPQNPQSLFVKKTIYLDLCDALSGQKISDEEKNIRINKIAKLCRIEKYLDKHPYDISGGEQQRAALAKVLLKNPRILILDEPTKGFDAHFKMIFARILNKLRKNGITIVMVSHDIEFSAEFSDRCALFFDGNITSCDEPYEFFCGKNFYTTSANRIARKILPDALLANDIISAFGGKQEEIQDDNENYYDNNEIIPEEKREKIKRKLSPGRIAAGTFFLILFVVISIYQIFAGNSMDDEVIKTVFVELFLLLDISLCFYSFFGGKKNNKRIIKKEFKISKRTIIAALFVLFAVPLTIFSGIYLFDDRKYYFISLLIIIETIIPFFMAFEKRKPRARELVVISVLCALAVAGRSAFFMIPQFKPVVSIVIIAGICFGAETGFLVGAVSGFVSNFFFGQGPWTPWQMFAFGIVGFVAGVLDCKGRISLTRTRLCVFGFLSTLVLYGGIMNPQAVMTTQNDVNLKMILSSYIMGFPFDMVHAFSTVFFLWFISDEMIEKLERIKIKYGLIENM